MEPEPEAEEPELEPEPEAVEPELEEPEPEAEPDPEDGLDAEEEPESEPEVEELEPEPELPEGMDAVADLLEGIELRLVPHPVKTVKAAATVSARIQRG